MNIKKIVSLLLASIILILIPVNSFAYGGNELDNFVGTYRGSYYAAQGHTGLTLKVYQDNDMNYKAKFNFYSVPENPSVPSGEYICDVKYNEENNQYIIIGNEWVNKPSTYEFVDLYGEYRNLSYSGVVHFKYGSGYTFDLVKQVEKNEPSKWAEQTVDNAVLDGIIPLELQGNYKDSITRAEFTRIMVATISKYEGKDIKQVLKDRNITLDHNVFSDTKDEFVLAAYNLKIIQGYGDGKFGPNDYLTREQAAKILKSMLNIYKVYNTNKGEVNFKDENKFSSWAKDDIKFITSCHINELNTSIMEGIGTSFDPLGRYTKEQSYLTVYRLLQYIK